MNTPRLQRVLTLKQLRLISVLGQELNLSRCAEVLHSTQPAISRMLAQTESMLGRTLFERTTKRVVPTSAGLSLMHDKPKTEENASNKKQKNIQQEDKI